MILNKFKKQPREFKDYDIDFSPWLAPISDTLDDVELLVTCLDRADDTSFIIDSYAITSTKLKFWVKGGTNGYAYKVEVKATTTGGRIDESEVIFAIGDI